MNSKDKETLKNVIKFGVETMGAIGVMKIIRNVTPYEGPFGAAACYVAAFLLTGASVDIFESQMLKYELLLKHISEGDKMVVF